MTDLKEMIEQEIDQYLEWPTADKSHVTTVSAKLFAEHVATLYADHFRGAGNIAAPAVQGEPVGYVNSDEMDNMLDDRTATIHPIRTGFHATPLYATPKPAEQKPAPDVDVLVEALEEIIHPVRFMQERLEEGERLNGMAAVQLAEDASYLRGIAIAALAAWRGNDGEK